MGTTMPGRADRFRLASFEPAYVALQREGALAVRAEQARFALESCRLCPRACGARRLDDEPGTCGIGRRAVVSSAFPHLGEVQTLRQGPEDRGPAACSRQVPAQDWAASPSASSSCQ